jgi:hypothetical protein
MNLAGAFLGLVIIKNKSHVYRLRRVYPNGSITVLASCVIATSGMGQVHAFRGGFGLNDFAIIALGITMVVYVLYYFMMKKPKSVN